MTQKLIGEELGQDLSKLSGNEVLFREGDRGELRLYLSEPVHSNTLTELESNIRNQGVVLTDSIVQDSRIISIKFQKAIAPLLIIAGAIVLIVGSLLGWQIFKTIQWGVPLWTWLVGGGALLYLLLRKPAKKAAPFAIEAGKVYITRKARGG